MNSHARIKSAVGMAAPGTTEYYRNAAIVLASSKPGHLSSGSKAKLQALATSGDYQTRMIARRGLGL